LFEIGFRQLILRRSDNGSGFGGRGSGNKSCLLSNWSVLCVLFGLGRDGLSFNWGGFGSVFGFDVFDGLGSSNFFGNCGHDLGRRNRLSEHASPSLDRRSGSLGGFGHGSLLGEYRDLLFKHVGSVIFVCGRLFGGHRKLLAILGSRSVGGMGRPGTSTASTSICSSASAATRSSVRSTTSTGVSSAGRQFGADGCRGRVLGLGTRGLCLLGDFTPLRDGA
jgi:hypothetical protein